VRVVICSFLLCPVWLWGPYATGSTGYFCRGKAVETTYLNVYNANSYLRLDLWLNQRAKAHRQLWYKSFNFPWNTMVQSLPWLADSCSAGQAITCCYIHLGDLSLHSKGLHKRILFLSQLNPFYSILHISEALIFKIIPFNPTSSLQVFSQNRLRILLPISSSFT
jgi:hypothetical protein